MSRKAANMKKHKSKRRQCPVWALIIMHAAALGIALLVYALPHHVIPEASEAIGTVSTRAMMADARNAGLQTDTPAALEDVPTGLTVVNAALPDASSVSEESDDAANSAEPAWADLIVTPASDSEQADIGMDVAVTEADKSREAETTTPEPTVEPTPEPTEEPKDEVGSFRIKFADKFTDGETKRTKNSYKSENLNIKISKVNNEKWDAVYYVVDIYVADISCFMTCFAQGKYGRGYTAWPLETSKEFNAVITMNGDYYGMRKTGVVIRNGKLYRNAKVTNDVCVLYWDGTMKTFSPKSFNAEWEMMNGAYQAWNFGPMLLDENGKAKTTFNSNVLDENPRSVVGYFEPGHYCFVAVDGRSKESDGLSMQRLAEVMEELGCKQAYNLDGGRTSMLYAGDTRINNPVEGGRKSSDFLIIVDKVTK